MISGKQCPGSAGRRRFLRLLAASGALSLVGRNLASAQLVPDYKALVCILLSGGNDGENTLIRYDAEGYRNYAAIRTPASGINIPQAQLQPIQPASIATPFGFHPACAPLKTLFDQKKLAVVANMGMLVQPSTKAGLETQGAPRPVNLFSHSDQLLAIQSASHTGLNRIGWGGRIADKLDAWNAGTTFPPLVSINSITTFGSGNTTIPLSVGENPFFALHYSDDFQVDALREAALKEIVAQKRTNTYDIAAQTLVAEGLKDSSIVFPVLTNSASIVPQFFAGLNSSVANQLKMAALMIEGRGQTQMKRQVFFVMQDRYDTHGGQPSLHESLLGELSQGLKAFQDAVDALHVAESVTSFTLSDFGRSFKPASSAGTDHGWGNYAFVVGGAVKGGDFYGKLPAQVLNGPDDLGKDGRWIPTTSLEQYGATLTRWFGMAEPDLPYVFPNIGAFANTNLGFMG